MPPLGLGGLTQRVEVEEFIHHQVPLEIAMPKDPHPSKYDPKIRHEMGGREVVEVVEPLHEGVERDGLAVHQTICVDRYMPRQKVVHGGSRLEEDTMKVGAVDLHLDEGFLHVPLRNL